jgi:hypothetical protein
MANNRDTSITDTVPPVMMDDAAPSKTTRTINAVRSAKKAAQSEAMTEALQ